MHLDLNANELLNLVLADLDDLKAGNIVHLDVRNLSSITDYMVIACGTSSRHVDAIARRLVERMKERFIPMGNINADDDCEWVLVDLGDVIVHVMQPLTRDFYNLEKLWAPQALELVKPRTTLQPAAH